VDEAASNASNSPQTSPSARASSATNPGAPVNGKYPALVLTDEEKRLCERENVRLPSHYPLSREEERNLKRIRRKIRNKVSAQDSRKRKKEYVDAMEERVKKCTDKNEELQRKIDLLETQNRTLAGQLRRLHQVIVGGGGLKTAHTSTAMMVLLLSTALFLLPGFKEQNGELLCIADDDVLQKHCKKKHALPTRSTHIICFSYTFADAKCELDISQAIKMPPLPGQSRSLLHFTPIKQEYGTPAANAAHNQQSAAVEAPLDEDIIEHRPPLKYEAPILPSLKRDSPSPPSGAPANKKSLLSASRGSAANHSYIDEDAPPMGYGPDKKEGEEDEAEERMVNVTRGGQGMRTVVLHVPKDIK